MKPWARSLSLVLLMSLQASTAQAETDDRLSVSTMFETRAGFELEDGDVQLFEFQLSPRIEYELTENIHLTSLFRLRLDLADELDPDRPDQSERDVISRRVLIGDNTDLELREFYLDMDVGDSFLRLGKQQIVWGEADGLKVLDVVNPQDFREFILPEFEDSRIPLWAVNLEMPVFEESELQLIWIPDQTYDDIPDRDATYSFTSPRIVPRIPAGIPVQLNSPDRPNNLFTDSDVGFKLSTSFGSWEASLNYLYHYADRLVLRRTITTSGITITPEYERTHLIGASVNNAFGDFVFRGEAGYSTNQFITTADLNDRDGVIETGNFSYVMGLDYSGITDTFISGQIFQSVLTDHQAGIARDEVDTTLTLLLKRHFMNETLTAESLLIHNLNDGDGLWQAELSYQMKSNLELKVGLDIFYGDERGLFGQFDNHDRIVLGIEWGFD